MRFRGEHLFVYGTLLLPEIMQLVSGRQYLSRAATLYNYARYGIRGKAYPGIVQQAGASVAGRFYINVTPAAWRRLDRYEDHFYRRERVSVETAEGKFHEVWTYAVPADRRQLLDGKDWSLQQFKACHLQQFMAHIKTRRHR